MSAIDAALSHTSAEVVLAGVYISNSILNTLPAELLRDNLAALVVGVYPIIEGLGNSLPATKVHVASDVDDMIANGKENYRDLSIAVNYYNHDNMVCIAALL